MRIFKSALLTMIRAMYISALLAIAAVFGAVYTTCPGSSSLVTGITDRCFEVVSQKQKFFQGLKECEGKLVVFQKEFGSLALFQPHEVSTPPPPH